jgi:peptidyl-prolyl cis-trans isomerase C
MTLCGIAVLLSFPFPGQGVDATGKHHLTERWNFLPETVASVNGEKISAYRLVEEIKSHFPFGDVSQVPPRELKNISRKMLDVLIDKILFNKLLEKSGIVPGPELVRVEQEKKLKKIPPEKMREFTKALNRMGETLDTYNKKIINDERLQYAMAVEKWVELNRKPKEYEVSDTEAEKHFRENQNKFTKPETVEVSRIMIKFDREDKGGKTPLETAEMLRARLLQGESFAKIAAEYSDCPSGKSGGNTDEIPRGAMFPEFDKTAFSLPEGEISPIIKGPDAFFIIKVGNRRKAGYISFEKVKDKIKEVLKRNKIRKIINQQLEKTKAETNIKINIKENHE